MKRNRYILFAILCLTAVVHLLYAQPSNATAGNEGTDFYLSFGNNGIADNSSEVMLQVRVIARQASNIEFIYKDSPGLNKTYNVLPGVTTINLSNAEKAAVYQTSTTGTSNKSLRIRSDNLVVVYILNAVTKSTDATNILPVQNLGTDYYHISYLPATYRDGYTAVATEDGTDIYVDNQLKAAKLQQGQIYSFYSSYDETGRHIMSNKPVAFFSFSTGTQIPNTTRYVDLLFQQLPPVISWGKEFFVPVTSQGTERVRIVGTQSGTSLTINGGTVISGSTSLNAGKYTELEIKTMTNGTVTNGCYIKASKPVGVCSYMVGTNGQSEGDPSMAWIAPAEQMIEHTTIAPFVPSGTTNLKNHYAMVVTPTITRGQTRMSKNGGAFSALSGGTWKENTASGFSCYTLKLAEEKNSYYTFSNTAKLFVLGYGVGVQESYYYLAGSAMKGLNSPFFEVNDIHYQNVSGQSFDGCNLVRFKAVLDSGYTGYIKWYINGVEETGAQNQQVWEKKLEAGSNTVRMEIAHPITQSQSLSATFYITQCATPKRILLPVNPGVFF